MAQALDIARETYLAILMDRESNGPVIVASPEGGMDIEEVAEKFPDKIFKVCAIHRFSDYQNISGFYLYDFITCIFQ